MERIKESKNLQEDGKLSVTHDCYIQIHVFSFQSVLIKTIFAMNMCSK